MGRTPQALVPQISVILEKVSLSYAIPVVQQKYLQQVKGAGASLHFLHVKPNCGMLLTLI